MASLVGAPRHCRPPLRTHVAADRRTLRPLELTRPSDELVVYPTLDAASAGR